MIKRELIHSDNLGRSIHRCITGSQLTYEVSKRTENGVRVVHCHSRSLAFSYLKQPCN